MILISTCVLLWVHMNYTSGQTVWNMHDACGTVISKADVIGELHFDTDQLPAVLPGDSCKITITPLNLNNQDGMVLFYFTEFRLRDYCEKTNVTIIDGASNNGNIINGLPRFLCGVNTTLERTDQFYSSSGTSLKIIYNANRIGSTKPGIFVMKFVSYHTASCYGSDEHKCSNGHCVPKDYSCSSDFNVCGDIDTNCNADETSQTEGVTVIGTIITVIFVIIFILFTLFGFYMVHRNGRGGGGCRCLREICECICEGIGHCCSCTQRGCSSCCDSLSTLKTSCHEHCTECCQSVRNKWSTCVVFSETSNEGSSNQVNPNTSNTVTRPNTVTSQPSSIQREPASSETASDTTSSSESDLETEDDVGASSRATPSAPPAQTVTVEDPPPSYEEAVAPSYHDYVKNKERFANPKPKRTRNR